MKTVVEGGGYAQGVHPTGRPLLDLYTWSFFVGAACGNCVRYKQCLKEELPIESKSPPCHRWIVKRELVRLG